MAGLPLVTTRSESQWRSPLSAYIPVTTRSVDEHFVGGRGFAVVDGGLEAAFAAARQVIGTTLADTLTVGIARDGRGYIADTSFIPTPYDTGWKLARNEWTPFRYVRGRSSFVDAHESARLVLARTSTGAHGEIREFELPHA